MIEANSLIDWVSGNRLLQAYLNKRELSAFLQAKLGPQKLYFFQKTENIKYV